ncbi:contractile injection system tape measure protein [Niastella caeni]|nr:contractile injection system tape measure protein [Niastella caeni]
MQLTGKHIIRKQVLDVEYNGRTDGFELQRNVVNWCHNQLMPSIEEQLEQLPETGMVYQIDKLEIHIDLDASENWMSRAIEQIKQQIGNRIDLGIQQSIKHAALQPRSYPQVFEEVFIYFLQHGNLPWWSPVTSYSAWVEEMERLVTAAFSTVTQNRFKELIKQKAVQQRIIYQVPDALFIKLVLLINAGIEKEIRAFAEAIQLGLTTASREERKAVMQVFRQAVMKHIQEKNTAQFVHQAGAQLLQELAEKGYWQQIQQQISQLPVSGMRDKLTLKRETPVPEKQEQQQAKKEHPVNNNNPVQSNILEEGIYVSNAGLVIMALFLPPFFTKLGLLQDGNFSDINRAVCLAQYLASGKEQVAEFELGLAKIVCGLETDSAVDTDIVLTEEEKQEVNELLLAVIAHWNILKDTSPDGLRETFLQREGRLQFINHEWRLLVEQKAWDVLLQHLPWTISIIKLPWMPYLLKTEWI